MADLRLDKDKAYMDFWKLAWVMRRSQIPNILSSPPAERKTKICIESGYLSHLRPKLMHISGWDFTTLMERVGFVVELFFSFISFVFKIWTLGFPPRKQAHRSEGGHDCWGPWGLFAFREIVTLKINKHLSLANQSKFR